MTGDRATLTQTYHVYLAAHDVNVDLPAGTGFTLYAKARDSYIGVYEHPRYGEIPIDTPHACLRSTTG